MVKSNNFVSECNVLYPGIKCSKENVYSRDDGTHIGEYYDKENCYFSSGCLEKSTCKSIMFCLVVHRNCQCYNV